MVHNPNVSSLFFVPGEVNSLSDNIRRTKGVKMIIKKINFLRIISKVRLIRGEDL